MKITKPRVLVILWTFALGVALSYRPPEIDPIKWTKQTECTWGYPSSRCTEKPSVRAGGTATLGSAGQVGGMTATASAIITTRRADLTTDTIAGTIRYCPDCGVAGSLVVKTKEGWREVSPRGDK